MTPEGMSRTYAASKTHIIRARNEIMLAIAFSKQLAERDVSMRHQSEKLEELCAQLDEMI